MKIGLKEIIIIAAVMVCSFPISYLLMLFATGNARLELTKPKAKDENEEQKLKTVSRSAKVDSLEVAHSSSYLALEQERSQMAEKRSALADDEQRVQLIKTELEQKTADLVAERKKIEKLIGQSDELDKKRIQQLAKVYSAMRATEAARILETLDDALLSKILMSMNDDRQKAKILSALSPEKAAQLSRRIGKQ